MRSSTIYILYIIQQFVYCHAVDIHRTNYNLLICKSASRLLAVTLSQGKSAARCKCRHLVAASEQNVTVGAVAELVPLTAMETVGEWSGRGLIGFTLQ
eukprot:scaffold53751_cov37-Cyclotella_meneghiniana.AAC.4